MTVRSRWMPLVALVMAVPFVAAGAQGKSGEHGRKAEERGEQAEERGRKKDERVAASVQVVFRDADRAMYRDYFLRHEMTAKPLPPGIAKRLARGKPLPPGIAKRMLPPELMTMGPRVDKDVSIAIVGDAVIATRAGIVIDILAGVFK